MATLFRNPKNVIIAGTPGAWNNVIAKFLSERGWFINWPGQDVDIYDGKMFLSHNYQNIEIHRMHEQLCWSHRTELISEVIPLYYDVPYPGPTEFLAKFEGQPVVISGTCLPAFLDIWAEAGSVVIDIQATKEEDINMLDRWTRNTLPKQRLEAICEAQSERYIQHLKLFPQVFTMSNSEVRDGCFEELSRFLNSVF